MNLKPKRIIAAVTSLVLAVLGFSALDVPEAKAALKGSMFDPGLIISDSVFYDFGTMTVDDIQRFLDSKVPVCKAGDAGPTCLRYYKMDTQAKPGEDGRCAPLPAKENQSAAQIIFDVATACKINPRVLLVTLQKEQGLVQAAKPTSYMYRAALGYGCPDSRPDICGKGSTITGLFNQLYRAAGQLQWYGDPRGSFTYLKVGTNVKIKYQADFCESRNSKGICTKWVDRCGSKVFQLKSQATAALYYYTPYTPNEAALKNLYGTGDSCSAYGNRNFWRFYSDWFGSTIGGGFLLKSADSPTYLIVDDKKYLIDNEDLVKDLAPLGPLGTVSQAYIDSFADSGTLTPLVQSATKQLFLVADGTKFSLANCNVAAELGLDCAKAVTLTSSQLNALKNGGASTAYVAGEGADRYLIDNGEIHEILDAPSVAAANITLPSLSKVKVSAFSYLPWGAPIASNRTVFSDRQTNQLGVYLNGQFYRIEPDTSKDVDFGKWFTPSAGSLSPQGLSAVESGTTVRPFVSDENGNRWLITADGKKSVNKDKPLIEATPVLPSALLSSINTINTTLAAPAYVKTSAVKGTYLVVNGTARMLASTADRDLLRSSLAQPDVFELSPAAFNQLTLGIPVFAPASTLKSKADGSIYLVNNFTSLIKVSDQAALDAFGLSAPRTVSGDLIANYNPKSRYSGLKVSCDSNTYIPMGGYLYEIDTDAVAHYPGRAIKLGDAICDQLYLSEQSLGRFIYLKAKKTYYLIDAGKKRPIANTTAYRRLVGDLTPAVEVDAVLAARIPTGTAAPNSISGSSGSTDSGSSDSTSATTYTVKAGDTLSAIALRFKVTLSALMTANKITNANSIKVGQVLKIPKS